MVGIIDPHHKSEYNIMMPIRYLKRELCRKYQKTLVQDCQGNNKCIMNGIKYNSFLDRIEFYLYKASKANKFCVRPLTVLLFY